MSVSSGLTLTQPPLRANWPWLLPVTWRATVPGWDLSWKYPKCHKRTQARGNAVCMDQKADWEQWSMTCRSQVLSPMGLLTTSSSHPTWLSGALSSLNLILSFSPRTTWIPSSCHALLAFTSSSCCSIQFQLLFPILPVVVQSHPFLSAKPTIPPFLTVVPPHRCPGLQCSLCLKWAGYFWAHTHPPVPACRLCCGSGPTKKGKCPSPRFSSFSCASTLI